jgi:hypothetical protein
MLNFSSLKNNYLLLNNEDEDVTKQIQLPDGSKETVTVKKNSIKKISFKSEL